MAKEITGSLSSSAKSVSAAMSRYSTTMEANVPGTLEIHTGLPGPQGVPGPQGTPGIPGKDGVDGRDGTSPTLAVSDILGGHRITITDVNGSKIIDVMNGSKGDPGAPGEPGKDGRGIVSITRTAGTGAAGSVDTYTITYTDNTTSTFTVYNGANGKDGTGGSGSGGTGADGEDGATFTPYVDANGNLSWSNDKGLANPDTVNIRGPKGDTGDAGKDGYTPVKDVDYFDGKDGSPGKDGVSATHSWNGTKLTITSASGTSSVDLKGSKGDKGDTGTVARTTITVTLSSGSWSSLAQTVTASGVTTSKDVIVSPAAASHAAYSEAGVYCSAQGSNSLTFKCSEKPSSNLNVNVMILG